MFSKYTKTQGLGRPEMAAETVQNLKSTYECALNLCIGIVLTILMEMFMGVMLSMCIRVCRTGW